MRGKERLTLRVREHWPPMISTLIKTTSTRGLLPSMVCSQFSQMCVRSRQGGIWKSFGTDLFQPRKISSSQLLLGRSTTKMSCESVLLSSSSDLSLLSKKTMEDITSSLKRACSTAAATVAAAAIWLIKRTFQPSIIRKKRKMGFLVRQRTVGGRRTLARRRAKGRARLGGGI